MDIFPISAQTLLFALLIFLVRVIANSLDTMRVIFTLRSNKLLVWILGFSTSLIFVLTIAFVLSDSGNVFNILAYAGGFATGNVVGMWIEERMAIGFSEVRVISPKWGPAILEKLREHNYAVTEIPGRGKDGMVTVMTCSIQRKEVKKIEELVREVDESAFITTEDVVTVRRGFWGV